MGNLERIQEINSDLRECIEKAESLPDAGSGTGSSNAFIRLYEDGVLTDNEITSLPNDFCRNWNYIKGLDIPNVAVIGTYVCYSCTKLTEVNAPNCVSIGGYSFYNCGALESINCVNIKTIDGSVFRGCSSLTNLTFYEATSIGTYGLRACTSLERVDFSKLSSIGNNAFIESSALVTVIIRTDKVCTLSNKNAFSSTPIETGTGYIYVPKSLLSDYQSASNWSTYAAQIRAIEDYPEITGG